MSTWYGSINDQRPATTHDVRPSPISRLERGELSPTIATVDRLLAAMGEEAELVVSALAPRLA